MIDKLSYVISHQHIPYANLALEEYLLLNVEPNQCILYLWQNQKTVVIGKNQNPWQECKISSLEQDGGFLARRLSGGGAVFHDLGNLNFTFLVRENNYNLDRQLEVILQAVKKLGINAKKSGRNDITIDGRKFSGNAFYSTNGHCYHHGTLLINVNMTDLTKYLQVDPAKYKSKGINSVSSRVVNLAEYNKSITTELMCNTLIEAFGEVYQIEPQEISPDTISKDCISTGAAKFADWDYKYGRSIPFSYELKARFAWGNIQIQIVINKGLIKQVEIYSDSMDTNFINELENKLPNCKFSVPALIQAIDTITTANELQAEIKQDIKQLIMAEEL